MVLLTGSTGIVGTRLLFDLLAQGKKVRAMKRPGSDLAFVQRGFRFYNAERADALFSQVEWVDADLHDIGALEDAMHGIDEVYHAAALVSYRRKDAAKLINTNTEGTANVVNIAIDAGVRKFCHISSVAAVGLPLKGLANEETVWKRSAQRSMYGFSKYLAEQEVWRGAAEGMPCVIVNPSVILGPAKPYQSSGALMHLFQKGPAYYPPGTAGFVDVRDVSSACIALMDSEKQNERYILNAGSVPFRQMLNHAAAVFGNKPPQVAIKPWMLELAWPLAALWATLTQTQASITRETARNACKALYYDSSKVQKAIGLEFISAEESLAYYKPFIEGL